MWRKHGVPAFFTRGTHRRYCSAMKAMIEGDDFIGMILMKLAPFTRQFNSAFVGFGAAVGKEHFVKAAIGRQ